jgi:hypothetical protein
VLLGMTFARDRASGAAADQQAAIEFRPYQRPVTIWVPPYAVAKCRKQLDENPGVGEAITHLAMQFWVPTLAGDAELLNKWESNGQAVAELRDWAHSRGVRAMLCIYNAGSGKWDWPLAKAAFADHRDVFVNSLVAEVERHKLDGVDVDLEGNGDLDADKDAFVAFIAQLSKELRARGKHLTVDTFAYKWNGPNQTWWAELFPHVDAIASMGYEETGASALEWRAYAAQRDAAGDHAAKLQIGMPSSKAEWRGNTAAEHLEWVVKDGKAGVAIWDAQLRAEAWRKPETWHAIKTIREPPK